MAEPRFILKDPNSEKETLIFLTYRINKRERLKYSTAQKVLPIYWNQKEQQPTLTDEAGEPLPDELKAKHENIRDNLARYRKIVKKITNYWEIQDIAPNIIEIRDLLENKFKKEPNKVLPVSFFEFIDDWIVTTPFTRTRQRKPLNDTTRKKYRATRNMLQKFVNHDKKLNGKISFQDINLNFYERFVKYIQDEHDQTENTIGKHIKCLKLFITAADEAGIEVNPAFKNRFFAAPTEDAFSVFLSEAELSILYNFDLTKSKRLDKVRDLFLIACRTALRFGDFINLRPENFIENRAMIKVQTAKTGAEVIIPCHPWVKAILEKWDWWLPPPMTNQVMNRYIKELCRIVGINTPVRFTRTRGGKPQTKTVEKWQLVSTHTGRRTAASLMYLAGIPAISIMQITGHTSEKIFLKYIKLDKRQHAFLMLQNPYFMEKPEITMRISRDNLSFIAMAKVGNVTIAVEAETLEKLKAIATRAINRAFSDRGITYTEDDITFQNNSIDFFKKK
jgi:integrase